MAAVLYERCAREYANYWRNKERAFVMDLAGGDAATTLVATQKAAGYFRIARNFPTAFDVERGLRRFEPMLQVFDEARVTTVLPATLVEVVLLFQRKLGDVYGGRKVLSAATKFLWLLHRDPVVIFDSQARVALGAPIGDYSRYLKLWYAGYELAKQPIAAACSELPNDQVDSTTASAEWFRRRVYDIYLWRAGSPAKKHNESDNVPIA